MLYISLLIFDAVDVLFAERNTSTSNIKKYFYIFIHTVASTNRNGGVCSNFFHSLFLVQFIDREKV